MALEVNKFSTYMLYGDLVQDILLFYFYSKHRKLLISTDVVIQLTECNELIRCHQPISEFRTTAVDHSIYTNMNNQNSGADILTQQRWCLHHTVSILTDRNHQCAANTQYQYLAANHQLCHSMDLVARNVIITAIFTTYVGSCCGCKFASPGRAKNNPLTPRLAVDPQARNVYPCLRAWSPEWKRIVNQ